MSSSDDAPLAPPPRIAEAMDNLLDRFHGGKITQILAEGDCHLIDCGQGNLALVVNVAVQGQISAMEMAIILQAGQVVSLRKALSFFEQQGEFSASIDQRRSDH